MFKSIDSVIKDFTKAVASLEALVVKHNDEADFHAVLIKEANTRKTIAIDNAVRAAKLAANIKSLLV